MSIRKIFTSIIILGTLIPAVSQISCRKQASALPDGTGLDMGNEYHNAFHGFFVANSKSTQVRNGSRELVAIYYFNNFMQRLDMPQKSLFVHITENSGDGTMQLQAWELPSANPYSVEGILHVIANGPEALTKSFPTRSCSLSASQQPDILPSLSAEKAEDLYQKTANACSKSKAKMVTRDEMSNGEWYGVKYQNTIGVISKYDLEKNGESKATLAFDHLLNYAFKQYTAK